VIDQVHVRSPRGRVGGQPRFHELRAIDQHGEPLGIVTSVLPLPAQDVLVIERDEREHMVPFVDEFIREVNLEEGTLVVENIPGLITHD